MTIFRRRITRRLAEFDQRTAELEASTPHHLVEVQPDAFRILTDSEYELWLLDPETYERRPP